VSHTPNRSSPFGLSGAPPGKEPEDTKLGVPETARYRDGGLLGRGGVGEVRTTHDRRLERDVARKVLLVDDPASEARLAREARITARLEHPGIVPVYDAGRDEDGRPWYTMRVVRGKNLADALSDAPDPADRAGLLRHFLDACEAVAFAHSLGVVHRDLKPANILVGEFGETQVADWGLAVELDDLDGADHAVGTPAYMSPEQVNGQPASPASDVFSLGVILYEILAGVSLWTTQNASVLEARADAPKELAAVVNRACQTDPANRYDSAQDLARDLSLWFDGRRVSAYEYSPWDLMKRAITAWRGPLAAAGIATAVGVVLVGMAWHQTALERDNAQEAEAKTLVALKKADKSLSLLQIERARDALERGDRPTSELLAATGLLAGEDPEARGILAAWAAAPRITRERGEALHGCDRVIGSDDARIFACLQRDQTLISGPNGSFAVPGRAVSVGWTGQSVVVNAADHELQWWSPSGERGPSVKSTPLQTVRPIPGTEAVVLIGNGHFIVAAPERELLAKRPCGSRVTHASVVDDEGTAVTLCDNGRVVSGPTDNPGLHSLLDHPDFRGLSLAGRSGVYVLGTLQGELVVFDVEGRVLKRHQGGVDPIRDLAIDPTGERVAVTYAGGRTAILDLHSGAILATLPGSTRAARWLDAQTLRRAADVLEDWTVPVDLRPVRLPGPEGVSDIDLGPDGQKAASAHGDGTVLIWDLARGRALPARWQDLVVKNVDFSPDGRRVIASAGPLPIAIIDSGSAEVIDRLSTPPLRRLSWNARGIYGLAFSGDGVITWPSLNEERGTIAAGLWVDFAATGSGRMAVLGRADGVIARIDEDGSTTPLGKQPSATDIAVSESHVAVSLPRSVVVLDWSGKEVARLTGGGEPAQLAMDANGGQVALGSTDGHLTVWEVDSGAMLMRTRAHNGRVSAIRFGEHLLLSGSWDRTVRLWDPSVFERSAEDLYAEISSAWTP